MNWNSSLEIRRPEGSKINVIEAMKAIWLSCGDIADITEVNFPRCKMFAIQTVHHASFLHLPEMIHTLVLDLYIDFCQTLDEDKTFLLLYWAIDNITLFNQSLVCLVIKAGLFGEAHMCHQTLMRMKYTSSGPIQSYWIYRTTVKGALLETQMRVRIVL